MLTNLPGSGLAKLERNSLTPSRHTHHMDCRRSERARHRPLAVISFPKLLYRVTSGYRNTCRTPSVSVEVIFLKIALLRKYQDQELTPVALRQSPRARAFSTATTLSTQAPNSLMTDLHALDNDKILQAMLTPSAPTGPHLPSFVKPLPSRIGSDEVMYLTAKGALAIPSPPLRNALLQCYVEFVYPYMPLLDVHQFIKAVDDNNGETTISLLLFQAVMFAAIAHVDMQHLRAAGYVTRRDARRDFFQRTRVSTPEIVAFYLTANTETASVRFRYRS